ncbi:MAG: biotin carboxylase N-terminal domain-containing protein, partial [Gimesia chilikensis]
MSEGKIKKLLVANRSEIAIRIFRSTHELGIRTVGIYTHEDRYALHRTKADEAYQIGKPGHPVKSYLDIDAIITLAKLKKIDAIHPGYGFLSENAEFAQACKDAGIIFVGPQVETLKSLGDKISARKIAEQAGVPVLGGSGEAITDPAEGLKTAQSIGFPIILKAAHGGGGRGMRVVQTDKEFEAAYEQARSESLAAFGS